MESIKNMFSYNQEENDSKDNSLLKLKNALVQLKDDMINFKGENYDIVTFIEILMQLYLKEDEALSLIEKMRTFPDEIIQLFTNIIMGCYIMLLEKKKHIAGQMFKFIKDKAKQSLHFSHLCFWNLLSCKYIYKKIVDLEVISGIINELMEQSEIDTMRKDTKRYSSIFHKFKTFDEFIHNNLISFNDLNRFIAKGEINFDKIKENFEDGNIYEKDIKWRNYTSSLNFVNDLISISELLRYTRKVQRKENLKKILSVINDNQTPFYYYNFFNGDNKENYIIKIVDKFSFCLSTKDHVPYHLLLAYSNYNSISDNEIKEENIHIEEEKKQTKEEEFLMNNLTLHLEEDHYNNNNNKINQTSSDNNQNKSLFGKIFSLSYYYSTFSSLFQCGSAQNLQENDSIKEDVILDDKNNKISPDSIGIFGILKFSDISKSVLKGNSKSKLLPLIIKGGEDLRQDLFVTQTIEIFLNIFKSENIDIFLQPLQVLSTGRGGIMGTLVDTTSLTKINKVDYKQFVGYSSTTLYIEPEIDPNDLAKSSLRNYFMFKYGVNTNEYNTAIVNFISSLAGYSLLCYILEIKDRNNGNILVNDKGHLIHIDFGFLLSNSPGNVNFEQAPFKLTSDFIDVMDGVDSEHFNNFKELVYKGFVALRKFRTVIIGFIEMFIATNWDLPCCDKKDEIIERIKEKFLPNELNENSIKEKVDELIQLSMNNWRTKAYDNFQKFCVGVS